MSTATRLINDPPGTHTSQSHCSTTGPAVVPYEANIGSYSRGKCVKCFLFETVHIYSSVKFSDTLSASPFLTACRIPPPSNK